MKTKPSQVPPRTCCGFSGSNKLSVAALPNECEKCVQGMQTLGSVPVEKTPMAL